MRLATTLELHAGGPGSGCQGPNCGRPKNPEKPYAEWTREEKNRDWAVRNNLTFDDRNRVRLYHSTPISNVNAITKEGLRSGSFLTDDTATAMQQAGRDRGLKAGKLAVFEAWIPLGTFYGTTWAQTAQDLSANDISLRRIR